MAGISGKKARIKMTAQTATTDASEATSLVGGTTSAYQINDATKRHLARSVVPTIKDGVTTIASSDVSIDYVRGIATMSTSASGAVTFNDFSFLTASYLANATQWTLSASVDALDITAFSTTATDPKFKSFVAGQSQATANLSRFIPVPTTSDPTFYDILNLDGEVVLELFPSDTHGHWEAFARITDNTPTAGVSDIITEGVTFQIDGPLYYSTST